MTDTVLSSARREVVIGFDRPFVMIGERINPTGRKILAAEMAAGDFSRVEADARVASKTLLMLVFMTDDLGPQKGAPEQLLEQLTQLYFHGITKEVHHQA